MQIGEIRFSILMSIDFYNSFFTTSDQLSGSHLKTPHGVGENRGSIKRGIPIKNIITTNITIVPYGINMTSSS